MIKKLETQLKTLEQLLIIKLEATKNVHKILGVHKSYVSLVLHKKHKISLEKKIEWYKKLM